MLLIIGIGNSLRRDDGAGLLLAAALAPALEQATGRPARVLSVQQLLPELAEPIADPAIAALFFCDAALPRTGAAPLAAVRLHPPPQAHADAPSGTASLFSHDVGPELLLAYAGLLAPARWAPPPTWLLTVAAADLEHGEGLSPTAQAALLELPALLDALLPELDVALRPAGAESGAESGAAA